MAEQKIRLSTGIEIEIVMIPMSNKRLLRSFRPIFEPIIYSDTFLDSFQYKYMFDDKTKETYRIAFDYYLQNTTSPFEEKRKDNLIMKNVRKFIPDNILFLDSFGYNELNDLSDSLRREHIKNLKPEEKKQIYESIKHSLVKGTFKNINDPIDKLIKEAFYQPLKVEGYTKEFVSQEFEKVIKVRNHFSKKSDPTLANYDDYKKSRKIFELIDIADILNEYNEIQQVLHELRQVGKRLENFAANGNLINIQTLNFGLELYSQEISDLLKRFLKCISQIKKDVTKNQELDQLIEETESLLQSSSEDQVASFPKFLLILQDKKEQKVSLLRRIEIDFMKAYRVIALDILKNLIAEQNLSKEEIRLFLFENVGIKSLGYAIPRFYHPLISFFNFEEFLFDLFLELLVYKNKLFEEFRDYLEIHFRAFLTIYPIVALVNKEVDSGEKKSSRFEERRKAFNSSNDEDHSIDDSESSEQKEVEEENGTEVNNVSFLENNPSFAEYSKEQTESEQNKKIFWKLIRQCCTQTEMEVLQELYFNNKSEKEIAEIRKTSVQNINNIKKNAEKKLKSIEDQLKSSRY